MCTLYEHTHVHCMPTRAAATINPSPPASLSPTHAYIHSKPVGASGLFVGGLREAKALVREGMDGSDNFAGVHPLDFKVGICAWGMVDTPY